MKVWYLISYKKGARNAHKLDSLLSSLGLRVLSPTATFYKPRKDRAGKYRAKIEPIFPGYMFVYFDYKEIHFSKIVCCPGVNSFIKFGGNIATISESVMNEFIVSISSNTYINDCHEKSSPINFNLHDSVCRIQNESCGEKRNALFIAFIDALQKTKDKTNSISYL
jgi:transcriptional antiterminator RfaH